MPFWVGLSVVFSEIAALFVEVQFPGHFMYIDFGLSVLSAGNGSGMIPKLAVNRGVHCSLQEIESSSDFVGKCRSIALEQNLVRDTLAALHVHSRTWRIKSTLDFEMNKFWAYSTSSFWSEYSVPFWVGLSVVFSEVAALLCSSAVSWSLYVERFWIECAEWRKWSTLFLTEN